MDRRKLTICVLFFAFFSFYLNAEEIDDKVIRAKLGLVQSLVNISDFERAMPIIQQLYEESPNNEDVVIQYAIILANKRQYSQAIELCCRYIEDNKEHKTIKLWLARFLSWDQQYSRAAELYSELIAEYPAWLEPARERARVLGWDRKYEEAIKAYQEIVDSHPNHPEVRREMLAKYALYNRFDISAIRNYKQWLALEPQDLEALYDSAQIYSGQGLWADAEKMYGLTLQQDSSHFMARQALEKVELYSRHTSLRSGFDFFEADSTGRTTDTRYWGTFAGLRSPVNDNTYLNLRQDNIWYSFSGLEQVYQQKLGLSIEYYKKPYFWASANYAHSIYPHEEGLTHIFGGEIDFVPVEPVTITVSHQREQLVDNSVVFRDKLYRDSYKLRSVYRPRRRLTAGVDYKYCDYSDDNSRNAYGFDINYYLFLEPRSLSIGYRYEEYRFAHEDADYFSPDSFHYNKVGLEWRQFLNKDELFWGANDTYYTLKYEVIFDVQQEVGHKLYVDFHHDWSDKCSSHIELSKTIYEHSETYSEDRLMFYTSLYF